MQFPIVNILIVPSKNYFMNEFGAFVTVYTQIPRSNLNMLMQPRGTVRSDKIKFRAGAAAPSCSLQAKIAIKKMKPTTRFYCPCVYYTVILQVYFFHCRFYASCVPWLIARIEASVRPQAADMLDW